MNSGLGPLLCSMLSQKMLLECSFSSTASAGKVVKRLRGRKKKRSFTFINRKVGSHNS